ncbi:MAG: UDP-N-acetylmuramoyl-tripeptide--D-alanyl-D-alanine ligase [Desulfurivibrionaceae bacterium]|nr:UDP-N-acetylmuramoyl-tripeptide--D-alanyl-D-alanine ligase [Desulfobulbales bacterium]MDT8335585.1 UDP-N-acetylmuramoyl-tripeptide--D-alanyl-D-alanine ligase [Desulfurivibrionaceae bacterium]
MVGAAEDWNNKEGGGSGRGWRLDEVLNATGGRLIGGDPEALFRAVSTDSRTIGKNDLFVALRGDKFAGERFCAEAVRRGAAGVVVECVPQPPLAVAVVLVADTLRALGDLAAFRRGEMQNLKVVAITGSSGKTTVKEMAAAVFGQRHKVLKTRGNFNNLVGLPLSLLPVEVSDRFAILEMGMNRPGEIKRLSEIAGPDIACINNIQAAHLEGLATIEGVARAKGELFAAIKPGGILVVNLEDPLVVELAGRYKLRRVTYGRQRQAEVRGSYLRNLGEKGFSFTLTIGDDRHRVRLQCLGRHNVLNALAAAALAHAAGIAFDDIRRGLELFVSYDKRMQVETVGIGLKVLNDTYNANPASMLAALETVRGLKGRQRSVALLGDMLELGSAGPAAHRSLGRAAARLGYDYLLAFGSFAGEMVAGAREAGMAGDRARAFDEKERLVGHVNELVRKNKIAAGDWLLVKGSRGVGMESVIAGLREDN